MAAGIGTAVGKPGKTEFPASWDDKNESSTTSLTSPAGLTLPPVLQNRNNRWMCSGTRDAVEVMAAVVVRSGDIWTGWPEEGGPGVIRNPKKERVMTEDEIIDTR